jgi:CBS-domain-containing membrane protein
MTSSGAPLPKRPPLKHIALSWLGGALAIGLAALIAHSAGAPVLMAPFGASAVLAFGVPDSPLAQPRNIVGGHTVTAIVGVLFLSLFGDAWWVAGLATASGIAAMQITRTVHPPAGANPLLVLMAGLGWDFVLTPVISGALLLTLVALVFNRLAPGRRYPLYW